MATNLQKNYIRYKEYFLNIALVYKRRPDLKMYLELFLSLVTISFFLVLALKPTIITILDLLKDIKTNEDVIVRMDLKIKDLPIAQNVFSTQIEKINLLETAVPARPDPHLFARQIEGIANKNSIFLLSLSFDKLVLVGEDNEKPEKPAFLEGAKEISITLSSTGSYANLLSFLSDLETLRRPYLISSVSLSKTLGEGVQPIILSVNGKSPYLKE